MNAAARGQNLDVKKALENKGLASEVVGGEGFEPPTPAV